MTRVILERTFDPPLTEERRRDQNARLTPCLRQQRGQWIRSHLSRDRTRMICVFEAPDAESVRMALRRVGVPFERVWSGEDLMPENAGDSEATATGVGRGA